MKNRVFINLSSNEGYFIFTLNINEAELKLYNKVSIIRNKIERKKIIKYFLSKNILLFIIENYIYPENKKEQNGYFVYMSAINAVSNFYKIIEQTLVAKDFFSRVPSKEFDNISLEMIYNYRNNPRFLGLFDYAYFENNYPEFYL